MLRGLTTTSRRLAPLSMTSLLASVSQQVAASRSAATHEPAPEATPPPPLVRRIAMVSELQLPRSRRAEVYATAGLSESAVDPDAPIWLVSFHKEKRAPAAPPLK